MAKVKWTAYGGWNHCLVVEHEDRTFIVPTEVGLRISNEVLPDDDQIFAHAQEMETTT